jgi:(2S)-methylsuccinyl-CoA dehydrogenase
MKASSKSSPTPEPAAQLAGVDDLLNCLRDYMDVGLRKIKLECSDSSGELVSDLLEGWQQASYDLAFCAAEIAAANALNAYALKLREPNPAAVQLALLFDADVFQSVMQRLNSRAEELGINRAELLEIYNKPAVDSLLGKYLNSTTVASIGREIIARDLVRLPANLDEEKELVRETFFRFTNNVVIPLAEEIHREDKDIPDAILQPAAELGCFGTCIPTRFGGLQPDNRPDSLSMIVVTEELSRGSLGAAGSLITRPEIAARALLSGGTEVQQQKWLPALAAGEMLCAIAITEPNTGSDVAAVSLKASSVEGGWLLNGSKTWSTFAGKSELLVVLARTNSDPASGHRGLSLFMIEKPAYSGHEFVHIQDSGTVLGKNQGKLTGKAIATIGYRGMHSFDLFFEDYFVPAEHIVGEEEGEGKGFYYTMAGFAGGRIQTAARATGVMQAAFEQALNYAGDRQAFGSPIGDYQLIQIKLARMLAALTASRQFSYAVAELLDDGKGQMEASLVKLFSCRAAEWITREAVQIHGGMGYAEESAVSRFFVDARVLSIFEGAEEVLALKVIARDLIENS